MKEYAIMSRKVKKNYLSNMVEELDELAKEGWRVVSCVPTTEMFGWTYALIAVLERDVRKEPEPETD